MSVTPNAGPSRRGWHRLSDFHRCPQFFAYRHVLGLAPVRENEHLALGALLHTALMWHYLRLAGRADLDPVEAMREAPARIAWQFERARAIYEEYAARYPTEPFQVLDVEREYEVTVGGYLQTLRLDLVVAWNGRVVDIDHKTRGRGSSTLIYDTDGQFLLADAVGRALLAPMYGLPWGGVVVNMISKSDAAPWARKPLAIDAEWSRRTVRAVIFLNKQIDAAEEFSDGDPWHYPRTGPCVTRNGPCEYLALCGRGKGALDEYVVARDVASDIAHDGG